MTLNAGSHGDQLLPPGWDGRHEGRIILWRSVTEDRRQAWTRPSVVWTKTRTGFLQGRTVGDVINEALGLTPPTFVSLPEHAVSVSPAFWAPISEQFLEVNSFWARPQSPRDAPAARADSQPGSRRWAAFKAMTMRCPLSSFTTPLEVVRTGPADCRRWRFNFAAHKWQWQSFRRFLWLAKPSVFLSSAPTWRQFGEVRFAGLRANATQSDRRDAEQFGQVSKV